MGDIAELSKMVEKYGYSYEIVSKMGTEHKGTICLLSLHKIH